ncbi:MAG: ATP-dependent helicase [Candidatus Lokiarchaeota archaeon]|nr:ATP-dependent helicase [Candidatus Lokiarchaeota archaeon]
MSEKEQFDEEHIFEFFEDDIENNLESEIFIVKDHYKPVNFQTDLNEEQLEIVNNLKGPMLVFAGAGSGKTRTIVYSVAKLLLSGVMPHEIMLVTFTNKAANEMISRVELLLGKRPKGIWAGTFHSIANRFLRTYSETAGLKPNYTIMDDSDSKALMKLSIAASNVKEVKKRFPTASMAKDILSYSINCNKTIKEVILWKYSQFEGDLIEKKLKEVYQTYARKKAVDGLLDFDDLLVFWNKLLDEKFIARLVANKIKHVLVDEYQDTNYIQDEIIRKIVAQNPDCNMVAVGDDAQSIYAFRGANFQNILTFQDKYPECKVYKITYNYRSTPAILTLANDSISNNKHQFEKRMKAVRQPAVKPFQVSVGTEEDQARFISNQVLKLRQENIDLQDMAVLYRAGHHSMKIELELQAKNIPYEVRSGLAFFERAHVKDLLAHLRVIDNPYDELSWARIFNIVPGIGSTSGAKIFERISKTPHPAITIVSSDFFSKTMKGCRIQSIGRKNLINHVKYFVDYGPEDDPHEVVLDLVKLLEKNVKSSYNDWENRIEDLNQLGAYAQNYSSIQKFLETLSLNLSNIESKTVRSGEDKREKKPMVLSTIHRAKGLEWKVVFIPMLCEDLFPSSRVYDLEEEFEEERRVFYVAVTRAKDQLYLISPSVIQSFRGIQAAAVSQFVSELHPRSYKKSRVDFKPKYNPSQPNNDCDLSAHFSTGFEVMNKKSTETQANQTNIEGTASPEKKKEFKSILDFTYKDE